MKIIKSVKELQELRNSDLRNKKIGFIPTMGALHRGHLSLIQKSVADNDYTIVSIYVNPRQFNDQNDYVNYPVNNDKDIELLESVGCNLLFMPSNDIYDNYEGYKMDFQGLDKIYEGEFRPGHFQGVIDIVYRLFDLVKPNNAYFGEKDFQQLAIIKLMVKTAGMPLNIIPCPIVREQLGLAMSSRNERLSADEREKASGIYRVMKTIKDIATIDDNPEEVIKKITNEIDSIKYLKTEYAVFCNPETLNPVKLFEKNETVMLCLAVWCEKIRLIDNISLQF